MEIVASEGTSLRNGCIVGREGKATESTVVEN